MKRLSGLSKVKPKLSSHLMTGPELLSCLLVNIFESQTVSTGPQCTSILRNFSRLLGTLTQGFVTSMQKTISVVLIYEAEFGCNKGI